MARGGRGSSNATTRRTIDLTGTLSLAEKNDLTILVTAITEKIHRDTTGIFDSTPILKIEDEHDNHQWLSRSLPNHLDANKENQPLQNGNKISSSQKFDVKPLQNSHAPIHGEEEETITPQLQELKKEASMFCRKWQQSVIARLKDLTLTDQNPPQSSFRGRGRGFRGASGGTRGGRGGSVPRVATTLGTG